VTNRAPIDEAGRFERSELLEHARPTRVQGRRDVLGRAGPLAPELDEDVAAK
jgi:hypothetical protein